MNAINMLGAQQIGATQIVLWVVLGLMLVALLVYPMITRRRQSRDFEEMVTNLSAGDKVMTNIGMIGTIKKINRKEDGATFLLETGEKTVIEFDVGAIARILSSVKPKPTAEKSKKAETVEAINAENKPNEPAKEEPAKDEDKPKTPTKKPAAKKPASKKPAAKTKK